MKRDSFEFSFREVMGGRGQVVTIRDEDEVCQVLIIAGPAGIGIIPIQPKGMTFIASENPVCAFFTRADMDTEKSTANLRAFLSSIHDMTQQDLENDILGAIEEFLGAQ